MSFLFSQPAPGVLPPSSVSFPEIANMPNNHLLGNNAGSEGPALSLNADAATALLSPMVGASASAGGVKGLVPASFAEDRLKFLRADGNWAQGTPVADPALDVGKVLATDGTSASWRYAGLGAGGFGTNNVILGQAKPASLTGAKNIIISAQPSSATTSDRNVLIGDIGLAITQGILNVCIGFDTNIQPAHNSQENVVIGTRTYTAGSGNTLIGDGVSGAGSSVAIGKAACSGSIGAFNNQGNVAIGAGAVTYEGNNAVAIGSGAQARKSDSVVIGAYSAAYGLTSVVVGCNSGSTNLVGANNTIVGQSSGTALTSGSSNVLIGKGVANALTGGSKNVIIGSTATNLVNPDEAVIIGHNNQPVGIPTNCTVVGSNNTGSYRTTLIGTGNSGTGENQILIGRGNIGGGVSHNIGIGLGIYCDAQTAIALGHYAAARAIGSIAIGDQANSYSSNGIAIGSLSGYHASSGRTIVIGAMSNTGSGSENIVLGQNSKAGPTTTSIAGGSKNIVIGHQIGNALTTGGSNTIISTEGPNALTTGSDNTIVGQGSGTALTTGSKNIFIGKSAGSVLTTGSNNIIIGDETSFATSTNAILIGDNVTHHTGGDAAIAAGGVSIGKDSQTSSGVALGLAANATTNPWFPGTAIGRQAVALDSSVAIGAYASAPGWYGNPMIAIGYGAISNSLCTVIGHGADANTPQAGATHSILLGHNCSATIPWIDQTNRQANNTFYIGSQAAPIKTVYLGAGGTGHSALAVPVLFTLSPIGYEANGSASANILTIAGAQGTGTGPGGDLVFSTAPAGSTAYRLNPHVERMRVQVDGIIKISCGEKHASIHGLTANHNATINNYYIGVDTSSAAITVKLPAAGTAGQGFVMVIKDETGNAATASRNITVDGDGSNIDGAPTQTINTNYGSVSLMCSGSAWFIM